MALQLSRPVTGGGPGRGRRIMMILVLVLLVHAWLAQRVATGLIDLDVDRAMPARIEVAYVREMALSAPPPTAAPAAPPPVVRIARAPRPAKPASAPERTVAKAPRRRAEPAEPVTPVETTEPTVIAVTEEPAVPLLAAASASEPAAAPTAVATATAAATTAATAAAASAPDDAASAPILTAAASSPSTAASAPAAFVWPSSTRMSYVLTGNYRGPVNGTAQVEWIRAGPRYQVHLDLVVGPSFAPIITRQMTSDGEITAAGLAPRRYDQDTKVVMRDRQRVTIGFEPDTITLANGDHRPNTPGMQDTASQFVQLTYVFSTRPELLRIGGTVDIPLALPHKVDVWTYDVVEEETLWTNFGPLPTIHLKPRRTAPPKVGELSAEIWFAPQLRYLPVRIRIHQDAENFLDLLIEKPPEIAAS